ncbi:MAG: phosphatase PAP2 family protein [Hydrogenophaga sp.]|nr:phosphatase PAP2 family protein [Hydrogenophaga sp.]
MSSSHAASVVIASPWLRLDVLLFRLIGAGQGPAWLMAASRALARWSWLPLLAVVAAVGAQAPAHGAWLALLGLAFAGLVQLAGKRLARHWQAQRPFVLGLCANHLGHSARAGFPSSHALVMGAVIGVMLPHTLSDTLVAAMTAIAVLTGWARVHTGAHFPLDVVVGTVAGLFAGLLFGLLLPF